MPYLFGPQWTEMNALDLAPDLERCPTCAFPLNKWEVAFDLLAEPERSAPIFETTDGFILASPSFRLRYDEEGWSGLTFRPLANGHFDVRAERTVRMVREDRYHYDLSELTPERQAGQPKPDTLVINHTESCATCGRYNSALGWGDLSIKRGEIPLGELEFVFGDIEMGQGDTRNRLLIVGDGLHSAHRRKRIGRRTSVYTKVMYQRWDCGARRTPGAAGRVVPLGKAVIRSP